MTLHDPVFSQTKYVRDNFWIENYTKKDGLPEFVVTGITQDKNGFLWMTTPLKLMRFDGYHFEVFDPQKDFPELHYHFNNNILQDDDGMLWMGGIRKGLLMFDPAREKFNRFTDGDNGVTSNEIKSLVKDKDGNIWAASSNGLARIIKNDGRVEFKMYPSWYSDKLLNLVDLITKRESAIINLSKVGDLKLKQRELHLTQPTELLVVCMGESYNQPADYGWIENKGATRVWSFDPSKWFGAGGAAKNKIQIEVVTLPAGDYKVMFRSNEGHSFDKWNDTPPKHPEYWGIQLFAPSRSILDTIKFFINESLKSKELVGSNIVNLLADTESYLWVLTDAGLEKLTYDSQPQGKIIKELFKLPSNFRQISFLTKYDSSHLALVGEIYDSLQQKNMLATLIYDQQANKIELVKQDNFLQSFTASSSLLRDRRNNTWLGTLNDTGDGIYVSSDDDISQKFRRLSITPEGDADPFEQIWCIFQDRQCYIWVGSRVHGLYKIIPEPPPVDFINAGSPGHDVSNVAFRNIAEDDAGNIWLANADHLVRYDRETKTTSHFPSSGTGKVGPLFIKGGNNTLFISEVGRLRQYDALKKTLIAAPLKIPDSLKLIGFDSFGNPWSRHKDRTDEFSLFIFKNGKFVLASFDSSSFANGVYGELHLGRNGNVWIYPHGQVLDRYRLNNETKSLTFVDRYLTFAPQVFDIHEQEDGIVWMATYEGVVRLDPATKTHKYFTKADGLPSDFIRRILPFKGKLWIMTDLGNAFLDTKDGSITVNREQNEFIYQNNPRFKSIDSFSVWSTTTKSDEIAVAGKGGFFLFRPETVSSDKVSPVLQLTKLNVNGKAIGLKLSDQQFDNLSFSHSQNDLEIEFVGLHYKRPSQNQYSYQLKGNKEDWVFVGHERIARYSNLSPGHYEFYLKASNSDGVWSTGQKMFVFTILPPWWQSWWAYASYTLLGLTVIWAYVSYRSRALKKENVLLEEKVTQRTNQLNQSLENLKAAQTQLIHSEKMASLGELTAGIAHEIQNPLNFINNFSDVNIELLDEMRTALSNGDNASAISISKDVSANEEKINHHGGRADGIVKGMLQHSRSTRGIKEPSDLNALADEYLRLSYHGMRAKDKSFNVALKTDFDKNLGTVNIISQDIGRVLLNLFNNSFYSVVEKRKVSINGYEPEVRVSTKKVGDKVEVCVRDNGIGMPKHILDKVFQPFFTTKPPGQGTGLGLSISYDMIVAHGGELKIDTKEGEYAEFIIVLPM